MLADVLRLAVPDGTSQASPGGEDDCLVLFVAGDMFNSFSKLDGQLPLAPDGAVVQHLSRRSGVYSQCIETATRLRETSGVQANVIARRSARSGLYSTLRIHLEKLRIRPTAGLASKGIVRRRLPSSPLSLVLSLLLFA